MLARNLGGCLGREAAIFAKLKGFLNVVGVSLGGHRGLPSMMVGAGPLGRRPIIHVDFYFFFDCVVLKLQHRAA